MSDRSCITVPNLTSCLPLGDKTRKILHNVEIAIINLFRGIRQAPVQ